MKRIASCSFGKDSLAAIILAEENGVHIDEAVYCRVMFDDVTSAELPEHETWIHHHAIPLLQQQYGIHTTVVQAEVSYYDLFYRKHQSGKHIGTIRGFPMIRGPWCNDYLKVAPIRQREKTMNNYQSVVGIAVDETKRIQRAMKKGQWLPLVEYGVTEAQAFEICKKNDLLSPAYDDSRRRLGCWFCHNQRIGELRRLRKEYPALWAKLMALDKDSPTTFKPGKTLLDFETRFAAEDMQQCMF